MMYNMIYSTRKLWAEDESRSATISDLAVATDLRIIVVFDAKLKLPFLQNCLSRWSSVPCINPVAAGAHSEYLGYRNFGYEIVDDSLAAANFAAIVEYNFWSGRREPGSQALRLFHP